MTLKHVVLPAPFGPIRPRISPSEIEKSTSLSAVKPPNCIVTWSTSSRCSAMGTSFEIGVALAHVEEHWRWLLGDSGIGRFQSPGPELAGQQALRTEDHHEHQHQAEPEVAAGVEEPEPLGQVAHGD